MINPGATCVTIFPCEAYCHGLHPITANIHAAAWKRAFDEYLKKRSGGALFQPFDKQSDDAATLVIVPTLTLGFAPTSPAPAHLDV